MKGERLEIRIPKEVKEKADKKAKKQNRSLSNYVVTLIEEDLNKK